MSKELEALRAQVTELEKRLLTLSIHPPIVAIIVYASCLIE